MGLYFVAFNWLLSCISFQFNCTICLLQEFDPPPWLNRMREIGYPPGYLGKCSVN